MESSRNMIMNKLVERGDFTFAGYIQNEVRATTLVLFKNVAKWYGIAYEDVNRITKEFSDKLEEKTYTGWLKGACEMFEFDWEDHWDMVEAKMGFCYRYNKIPYNKSTAASGVIMIDGEAPVPVRDGTVMFNGSDLEKFGYIKYDILTVTTMDMIQHFYGIDYDWNDVHDPNVYQTICNGDNDFVFQMGSPGMNRIAVSTQPRNILAIADIIALWRPGPIEAGFVEKYIRIKTGEDPQFTDEEKILSVVLKKAFGEEHVGLVIFQEDVMRICQDCANFTMTEADEIRRAMGKKDDEILAQWKEPFIRNWNQAGDPEKVWEALAGFAHYAFNKSHSVAYAIIGYATAKLWTYQKNDVLEYCLNDGTKENYALAMAKCKELGIRMNYPNIETMGEKRFKITEEEHNGHKRATLWIPIEAEKSFDSYVSFLFDEEIPVANLIYQGVCDRLSGNRLGLAELATTLLSKAKKQALFMEPPGVKFNRLEQILDGLKLCEGIVDWSKNEKGVIEVKVRRARGEPNSVFFYPESNDEVRAQKVGYDLKKFKAVRNGLLSDLPDIDYSMLETQLNNIKSKAYENGRGEKAYDLMCNHLKSYMREYYSDERRNTFYDIYALVEDSFTYGNGRSVKLTLHFNNCSDILYATGPLVEDARRLVKNSLVKMTLVYSPFIKKRGEIFIYDFDIKEMEVIKLP
jgi:hypothetical protein